MLFLHALPAKRAFLPESFLRLISSQMNISRGEDCHHFVQNILQKCKGAVVSGTVNHSRISSAQARNDSNVTIHHRASQLRIGSQCGVAVGGHIYFGDNLYLAVGSVCHHFLDVFLRIESSDRSGFSRFGVTAEIERNIHTVHSPCAHFRQAGIFLDFYPPAVIIREVEMKRIDFEHAHAVDDTQHVLFGNEEAGGIQHQCPIAEARFILNGYRGNAPLDILNPTVAFDSRRQQQADGLQCIEKAFYIRCFYLYLLRSNLQLVGFAF